MSKELTKEEQEKLVKETVSGLESISLEHVFKNRTHSTIQPIN